METQAGTKKGVDVAKFGGAKWKDLSEALTKPYEDKAKEAKEEYDEAMKEWKAKSGNKENVEGDGDEDDEGEEGGEDE